MYALFVLASHKAKKTKQVWTNRQAFIDLNRKLVYEVIVKASYLDLVYNFYVKCEMYIIYKLFLESRSTNISKIYHTEHRWFVESFFVSMEFFLEK